MLFKKQLKEIHGESIVSAQNLNRTLEHSTESHIIKRESAKRWLPSPMVKSVVRITLIVLLVLSSTLFSTSAYFYFYEFNNHTIKQHLYLRYCV